MQGDRLAHNVTYGYCLCVPSTAPRPSWDRLYQTASAQAGHFTTKQAADAGFSTHLLFKHIRAGRVFRVRHGVYRLVHFPSAEHEELAVVWLWSDRKGVFSHQTALALHGLSDVLPNRIHLTLPAQWSERRLRVPAGVALHYASVPNRDRAWSGPVPITSPRRTLVDCAKDQVSPDLLRQAAQQALRRGLVTRPDLHDVEVALEPFGGLAA
jgi:predicted transcriptional regulator of viral defense system